VFTVIIIVIIIVVVPPPMYNNIVEKNNKNCTACTSCSAAFRYAITGGGFLVLAIGSSAAAIFRLYVVQHRLQCTYYYYYYHYVYIVWVRAIRRRTRDRPIKPVHYRIVAAGCMKLNYRKCRYLWQIPIHKWSYYYIPR